MQTTKEEKNILKRPYLAPAIEVILIEMEQGIAAGSATLTPNPLNPEITDWKDPGTEGDFGTGTISGGYDN
ncbi:hypothetical protein OZ664_03340 [Elizabethkingia sp. HX WHF]|uniref:hypothetical protein n=1 Tax=Elizabethkingia TaxID=308865 RepID=UPI000999DE40|nr:MULTISPECIES: hypothetical protein [Elizabethkingia]ATL42393.1 hypothetical protein CQS02_03275 [Elizabethkingia miricola]MCL1638869.1 hypothetical protein [Elizabethkingia bruuniana]MDX8563021.1 hypothetical protein [Elizabethkingia sp. HX WHF]OPC22477.1 hypothetical protein BAY00_18225 [Elizabethkingia bruuniana]